MAYVFETVPDLQPKDDYADRFVRTTVEPSDQVLRLATGHAPAHDFPTRRAASQGKLPTRLDDAAATHR